VFIIKLYPMISYGSAFPDEAVREARTHQD